ncbi:MAG: hypothetical protein DRI34_04830 [Deltaproteobacteria bacterium]|nr:MAG: hypothetical protein DRI34_04830 [Deltaproteobacteria bacterium]
MNRLATILLVLLAGMPLRADESPRSARQTFLNLYRSLEKKDLGRARQLMLDVKELKSFARWRVDDAGYQRRLEDFLRGFSAELNSGVSLKQARLADVLVLPRGKKNRRRLVLAVIHASFSVPGRNDAPRPMPFFLIEIDGHWKLWLRH